MLFRSGIILTKRIGTIRDTVASGTKHLGAQGSFIHDSIMLNYRPNYISGGNPDSAIIYFASSNIKSFTVTNDSMTISYQQPQVGSMLWVDDCFFNWVGLKENQEQTFEISAFPNPSYDQITLTIDHGGARNIKIIDMLGNVVREIKTEDKNLIINTNDLSSGTYFVLVNFRGEPG